MESLKRSKDRKVAADVTPSGGIKIANSFGLPSGLDYSCPGQTETCKSVCYAGKLEKVYKGVRNVLLHNWDLLVNSDESGMTDLLRRMIQEFSDETDKKGGTKSFRIHWDGDFFSRTYASAWRTVIEEFPNVQFWVYTRTFTPELSVIDLLVGLPNLSVYLSVDRDNIEVAKKVRKAYPSVLWAFLGETDESTKSDMLSLFPRPGAICPENVGRIPLITESSGACIACNLCVVGKADVRFAVKKK